jgi:hypothetical protein
VRKPRDIKAELESLRAKEAELRAAHKNQLVELLERTGADQLAPELLAGALLGLVEAERTGAVHPQRTAWQQRGAAFFRPRKRAADNGAAPPPADAPNGQAPPPFSA